MSQSGYTPIQLYRTTTAAATPSAGSLAAGELAINLTDEKLYFKNASGTVKLMASSAGALGTVTSVNVSGGTTGLSFSGGPVTSSGTITMAGTLGVVNGGTGAASLTSGYLVKGNGTSAVTASVVYDTGTNVGIGTSSPSAKLHVRPTTDVNHLFSFSGTSATYLAVNDASSAYVDYLKYANTFQFYTASTERMRILASGNVGIGTATPSYKFVVSNSGASGLEFGPAYSGTANLIQSYSRSGATFVDTVYDAAQHRFNISGSEKVRIDSSGNAGIGTTAPAYRLSVADGDMSVTKNDDSAASPITYMRKARGTASSPTNAVSGDNIGAFWFSGYSGSVNNNGYGYGAFIGGQVDGALSGSTVPGRLIFATTLAGNSTPSERMRIDSTGNVGIGTTAPSEKLSVSGNIQLSAGAIKLDEAWQLQWGTGVSYVNGNNTSVYSNAGGQRWLSATNSTVALSTSGVERMRIDTYGSVGIGTTTPSSGSLLDVQSTTRGVRFPNMTTTQKNAIAASAGTVVFDTTLSKLCVYTGAAWQTITSA